MSSADSSTFPPVPWRSPAAGDLQEILPQHEVLDFIGRGGMGAVYKARQKSLNRIVAIKLLPPSPSQVGELDFAARFKVEAQAMARLSHPNIVPVHDFGESDDGHLYYVMEFVEGTDLAKRLESEGKLSAAEAIRVALAACDALICAHAQGVVHRDIKPSNILMGRDGSIKVADFGLAKMDAAATASLTLSGTSMGSQGYAAPEVFAKAGTADHRADIYSLGVVLYEMLTGDVPRGMFKLPSEKVPGLDTRLDALVCKAMEEDREERYQSVAEMRQELWNLQAPATTPLPPLGTSVARGSAWSRMASIASAVVIAIGGLLWLVAGRPSPFSSVLPPSKDDGSLEIVSPPHLMQWQDVLAKFDLAKYRRAGAWKVVQGQLENTDATQGGDVELPITSAGASDLRIKMTRLQPGSGKVIVAFHIGSHGGQFAISDYAMPRAGLEMIDGKGIADNGAHVEHAAAYLSLGHPHELLLRLREEGVTATLDGVEIYRWKGDWSRVSQEESWKPAALKGRNAFAISCGNGRVRLEEVAFRQVNGPEGKALPLEPVNTPRHPPLPEAQVFAGNGHRYLFVPGACIWSEAEANAKSMGGHLATLTTQDEHDWVWRTFSPWLPSQMATAFRGRGWWIGGLSSGTDSSWKWVTDEPFSYTCWSGAGAFPEARVPRLYQHDNGGGSGLSAWSTSHYSTRRPGYVVEWDTPALAKADSEDPEPVLAAPPDQTAELPAANPPTDAELRAFAAWLFAQPKSTEPTHVGPNQVPDLLVEGVARNLRRMSDLPVAPLSIARVRMGPLQLDDTARKQLAVLSRIQRLADFRVYGAEDPGILVYLRDRTLMRTLSCKGSPALPVMNDEVLANLALLTRLKTLRLDCWRGLTGTGFAHLKEKRYLDSLTLIDCPDLTDAGLAEIARFTNIRVLAITLGAGITDAGLAKLAKLDRLDQLTLKFGADAKVTGQGLAALAGCKELDALQLEGAFPGAALEFVGRITSLQELQCWHNPTVTDAAVRGLASLTGLRDLRLGDTRVSGEGFKDFKGFTALQRLRVDDCYISDEGLRAIASVFPELVSIALSRNKQPYSVTVMVDELSRLQKLTHLHCGFSFKDEHLVEVARLSRLTSLSLQYSFVTDAGIPHLKPMTQLEELHLVELPLTDACVPALADLRGLKSLVLTGTKITDNSAADLQKALPDCKIIR